MVVMSTTMGKKITLFLVDELPKGIREIRIDQWVGKTIGIPRNRIKDFDAKELNNSACVYFLLGSPESGDLLNVYVGETDLFSNRLSDHNYKKDWWSEIIVFYSTDGSLVKTGAKYLEYVCIKRLAEAGKSNLMNGNTPALTTILKEDISGLEYFFKNITIIMPLLGYDIFEQKLIKDIKKNGVPVVCKGNGAIANGIWLEDGRIVVLKGSTAVKENAPSFNTHNYRKLKDKMLEIGRLKDIGDYLGLTDDYEFDSPSAAAAVILARSAAGPNEWKDENGKKLRDLMEE